MVRHFVLHADRDTLVTRIENDDALPEGVRRWRLDHVTAYQQALPWLEREAEVIDTSGLTADQVTEVIRSALARAWPPGLPGSVCLLRLAHADVRGRWGGRIARAGSGV